MTPNNLDYVVILHGNRNTLVRIIDVKDVLTCKTQEEDITKQQELEILPENILVNLGQRPAPGQVYGVKVEPLVKQIELKQPVFKHIKFYAWFQQQQRKDLVAALNEVASTLKRNGVHGLQFDTEVRACTRNPSATLKHLPKKEQDLLVIRPEPDMSGVEELVYEQVAHAVWHRRTTVRQRLQWIKLYHEHVVATSAIAATLDTVLEHIATLGSITDYMKGVEGEQLNLVKAVIKHINRVHGLTAKHLGLIMDAGESLEPYWPTAVELSTKTVAITEHGMRSPEHLFAEAFAFHLMNRKIPRKVTELLDSTLRRLK